MSYSSLPKCPSLCLNPLKHSLDHIWIWKIGSNIIKMWFQSILTKQGKTKSWNLQFDLHRKIKCQNKCFNYHFLTFSCLNQHFYPSYAVDLLRTKVHLKWELGMWSNCHVSIIAKAFINGTQYYHNTTIGSAFSRCAVSAGVFHQNFDTVSVYNVNITDVITKQAGKRHYMHIFKS